VLTHLRLKLLQTQFLDFLEDLLWNFPISFVFGHAALFPVVESFDLFFDLVDLVSGASYNYHLDLNLAKLSLMFGFLLFGLLVVGLTLHDSFEFGRVLVKAEDLPDSLIYVCYVLLDPGGVRVD